MILFYWIKIIHVLSAALLFGAGVGTAIYYVMMNQSRDLNVLIQVNRQVGYADWAFTAVAGIIQPITGFTLIYLKHYPLTTAWWVIVLFGFGLAALCWFPAVYLRNQCLRIAMTAKQNNMALPKQYKNYYYGRCILSLIAFLILIVVFYFMANVPQPL